MSDPTFNTIAAKLAISGPCTWDASVRFCFYCGAEMGQGNDQTFDLKWHTDTCLWVAARRATDTDRRTS